MSRQKKSFFKERTAREISNLKLKPVYNGKGLVEKILDLNPADESIELRFRLTPVSFFGSYHGTRGSRLVLKHGEKMILSQPKTREEALATKEIPLAIRQKDFEKLRDMNEEDNDYVGYSFRRVQGRDERKRVVPFVWLPEGVRLFGYAESMTNGIEIEPFADSKRVSLEGAEIIARVPSRRIKKSKYTLRMNGVTVDGVTEKRAVAWSLKSEFENGYSPEHDVYNIRYTREKEREGSDILIFGPHSIAAYIAIIKHYNKEHNLTPIEMSPLALISKKEADFYNRLNNNVIIYDPSISVKSKQRKLRLSEKSILISRSIGVLGADETMYWNPERDGKLKDYDWSIPGTK
jgi:hypothetical protein